MPLLSASGDRFMAGATLDHVVVDARDGIDAAAAAYGALGFTLTPRGHHTLGSSNNLAIFGSNYLEILGFGESGAKRPELLRYPVGLNGLVFKTASADATAVAARAAGVPALPVNAFSRPVELGGERRDAAFRTTHLPAETSGIGRVYFCQHLTPELVWRPEWQAHANGAQEIVRVLVATDEADRQAGLFAGLFGTGAVTKAAGGKAEVALAGGNRLVLAPVAETLGRLGEAAPDAAGRGNFLAGLAIRVGSAAAVARLLAGLPGLVVEPHRVTVPAQAAFNTALLLEDGPAG
jgi:hypothetical protein